MLQRTISIFIIILLCSGAAYAQQKDSAADYSEKPFVDLGGSYKDYEKQLASTVIIIDRKIYTLQSPEWRQLKKENIASLDLIKDEKSSSPIKYIISVTTKSPK